VRFRWLVVAFWLVVAIVVSGAFPSLGSEVNNDNSAFLRASAPGTKASDLAAPLRAAAARPARPRRRRPCARPRRGVDHSVGRDRDPRAAHRAARDLRPLPRSRPAAGDWDGGDARARADAAPRAACDLRPGRGRSTRACNATGCGPGSPRASLRRPALTLGVGVVVFLALAAVALGYSSSGFGGATSVPSGSGAAAGNTTLAAHFPQTSSNPANLVFAYAQPDRAVVPDRHEAMPHHARAPVRRSVDPSEARS
jgi:hypothetical protein